jgi:UDP-N-acetylmuramoyl-L-alanyl-D-glutamate--2,6-diaminopimelate ligase
MKWSDLLAALPQMAEQPLQRAASDLEIRGIASDSRQVRPGDLFVAIQGMEVDGHSFIGDAVRRGAVAVIGEEPQSATLALGASVPYFRVPSSREALAWLAAAWHGYPGRKLRVIGVTGTDGKTTTVRLIAEILRAAGYRVGWIHTVSACIGGQEIETGLHTTTPDALDVQRYLARMVDECIPYAVIEATSHGLAQHRVTGCEFDVAVVTNITHEHLDYHRTYDQYRAAKAQLFEQVGTSYRKPGVAKVCVLNADDSSYDFLERFCTKHSYSYGIHHPSDVEGFDIHASTSGLSFKISTPTGAFAVQSPLVGLFNAYNILAAVTATMSQGVPFEAMQHGISVVKGVTGRMERIELGQDFTVIVDFAHTPNALENALQTVRTLTQGKVIVVFGCAGLRDRAKRPRMGEIAGRLADDIVLTAEDPRTEDVNDIIEEIVAGCEQAGCREGVDFWRVPDRGEAIASAINRAQPGDLVIVTGKGHERSMCFGTTEHPWSDHEAVMGALRARLGDEFSA